MPIKQEQRVAVFIDVQNLYHSAKHLYGKKVNFKEVLKGAVAGRNLVRAMAYGIKTEGGEEKGFYEALKRIGIEVKMKDLQVYPGGLKKGDWDVGIAVDAIKFSDSADVIVLITGDGDFFPLVEYIKYAKPALVEIAAFGRSASGKLKEVADSFLDLGKNTNKYLLKT
ncbi:MAG: NYN domain-containing protein [Candidatus Nealsonbacteria bacterium]|nr:NYN domain-containing protein [Candidatus Nealsonbacteria bacterium]